ncbi:MAG: response regulator [Alkalispirochaeta sp.]
MNSLAKTLLLVEDEALIALNTKMQLEKIGYSVSHVLTGEAAVNYALNPDSRSDLILMDINLGNGIDGTQAAEQILNQIEIPVVFLSSHTDPKVVEKTENITSYGYVVKNSGLTVLDASIKMAFKLFDAKQQHARSEKEYRRLFDTMPTGIVHQSADGTITSVNPAAERMLGSGLTEMIGKPSLTSTWKMIDENGNAVPDDEDPAMLALKTRKSVGPVERGFFVSEKGEYVWLKITATPLFNPGEDPRTSPTPVSKTSRPKNMLRKNPIDEIFLCRRFLIAALISFPSLISRGVSNSSVSHMTS